MRSQMIPFNNQLSEYKHVKKIINIAMAFYGNEVDLQYQIESIAGRD